MLRRKRLWSRDGLLRVVGMLMARAEAEGREGEGAGASRRYLARFWYTNDGGGLGRKSSGLVV